MRTISYISCDGCKGVTIKIFNEVLDICALYTSIIERCEAFTAFIDITQCKPSQAVAKSLFEDLSAICPGIKMGVGHNKFIARLASEYTTGIRFVSPSKAREFLKPLPISKLWAMDKVIRESLMELGITTIGELQGTFEGHLCGHFGIMGKVLLAYAEGEDLSSVVPNYPESILTSMCNLHETDDLAIITGAIKQLAGDISERLEYSSIAVKGLILELTDSSGNVYKQYRSFILPVYSKDRIYEAGRLLFSKIELSESVAKLEMSVTRLCKREFMSLDILGNASRERKTAIQNIVTNINQKFGDNTVKTGDKLPLVGRLDWLTHPIAVRLSKSGSIQVFKWKGKWRRVEHYIEHWIEGGKWWIDEGEKQFFFVASEDGGAYELFYDTLSTKWLLYAGLS